MLLWSCYGDLYNCLFQLPWCLAFNTHTHHIFNVHQGCFFPLSLPNHYLAAFFISWDLVFFSPCSHPFWQPFCSVQTTPAIGMMMMMINNNNITFFEMLHNRQCSKMIISQEWKMKILQRNGTKKTGTFFKKKNELCCTENWELSSHQKWDVCQNLSCLIGMCKTLLLCSKENID